jgi:hypothetical protein
MSFGVNHNIQTTDGNSSYLQERINHLLKLFKEHLCSIPMAQEVAEVQEEAVPPVQENTPVTTIADSDITDQLEYLLNNTVRHSYNSLFTVSDNPDKPTINQSDSVRTMNLETVKKKAAELRAKLNHWWTFADVVPTWERTIERALKGEMSDTRNKHVTDILTGNAARCIMGEGHGGSGWSGCNDCNWLGNNGLELFVKSKDNGDIIIKSREGFEEYKVRYEYHWNKYHFEQGDTKSKAPHF